MNITHPLLLAMLALTAALPAPPADAATPSLRSPVVRTLTPAEASAVDGLATVPQVDLNLRASAAVVVSAWQRSGDSGQVEHRRQVLRSSA